MTLPGEGCGRVTFGGSSRRAALVPMPPNALSVTQEPWRPARSGKGDHCHTSLPQRSKQI